MIRSKDKRRLLIGVLVFIELISIFFCIQSYMNKGFEKIKTIDSKYDTNGFTVMLQTNQNTYEKSNSNELPSFEYVFNPSRSYCMDSVGKKINTNLSYDYKSKKIVIGAFGTSKCFLAFDLAKMPLYDKILSASHNDLTDTFSPVENGRYFGSGDKSSSKSPKNFICFGTYDVEECKANPDLYMYRIIGVFDGPFGNAYVKLIKYTQLDAYKWNNSSADVNWENSSLYQGLNGSYFLTNTSYWYMQDSNWSNEIVNWTWSAVNTKTVSDSGPNYNRITAQDVFYHEMNSSSKSSTIGSWTTPQAKIGIMYASDYLLFDGIKSINYVSATNYNELRAGWLHQSNNDITKSSKEWTMARYGLGESYWDSWYIKEDGSINVVRVDNTGIGVRPVFYLRPEVHYDSGTGDYNNPFIIASNFTPTITATLNNNILNATITPGDYSLFKYCVNSYPRSTVECTWKDATNEITETLSDHGSYYVHVIDKGGYLTNSKEINYS